MQASSDRYVLCSCLAYMPSCHLDGALRSWLCAMQTNWAHPSGAVHQLMQEHAQIKAMSDRLMERHTRIKAQCQGCKAHQILICSSAAATIDCYGLHDLFKKDKCYHLNPQSQWELKES